MHTARARATDSPGERVRRSPARLSRKDTAAPASPRETPAFRKDVDGVAFAVFVAFVVFGFTTSSTNQFVLPKLLVLALYAAFAAVRWGVALRKGRVVGLPRGLAPVAGAVVAWWIATTVTAQHAPTAISGMRGRHNGLAATLAEMAVFVLIATTRLDERQIERRLAAIAAVLTAASAYALAQAAGLDPLALPAERPAATMGHPVIFAGALALALPFAVGFALAARSRRARLAWTVATLVQLLALAVTLARGPWIAAALGVAALAALSIPHERAAARRLAGLAAAALLALCAALALSSSTRQAVLGRLSTYSDLAADSSVRHRLQFYGAALAMLRDHPVTGVGLENFGLLYPRYRPPGGGPEELAPSMVHSGPLQTAVSGGVPALVLQLLLLGLVAAAIARRRRLEDAFRSRILGAAFLASLAAFVVQDLSGWPHVALGTLAFAVLGLGIAWSGGARRQPVAAATWMTWLLPAAIALGGLWLAVDTTRRMQAETLMFQAEGADVRREWASVEPKLRAALEAGPDRAWTSDAAARVYARRAAAANDAAAYRRAAALFDAALVANPFDPYVRLRRAELDRLAVDHRLIPGITAAGRDALRTAGEMTPGSALTRRVEKSLDRRTGGSRILWIEPGESAGFGPPGSLVVAGSAPRALAGTRVVLHWRNRTRDSAWVAEPNAPSPGANGVWYNAIPNANAGERYEVYSTSETLPLGRCAYPGYASMTPCAPLTSVGPAPGAPLGTLFAGGAVLPDFGARTVHLRWRNAARRSPWRERTFRAGESGEGVSFPRDAPGTWYALLPDVDLAEPYEIYLSCPPSVYASCTYPGGGARRECAGISWIAPSAMAGLGPAESLVVAGTAAGTAPVFLHWRNATVGAPWRTEVAAPTPDDRGTWYNFIPRADPRERYEVFVTSPTTASEPCTYGGDGARTLCP